MLADPGGFSDEDRDMIWANRDKYINTVVEVKCNGVSQDRDYNYSLLHPVFKEFRDDTEIDTLDDVLLIEQMILGLEE
jgi:hypothetical protein